MIKTGEKISLDITGQFVESGSDLIITNEDDRYLHCFSNPASKAVNLGDEKFARNLISCHQVSQTLLLTQSQSIEVLIDEENQPCPKHHWSLWQTNGTLAEMSKDLSEILHSD